MDKPNSMNGLATTTQTILHGGNLSGAQSSFPNAPKPWLDLSTGINPLPYPVGSISHDVWARLPDATALHALEVAAAQAYGAREADLVVATPGTQALLQLLPRLRATARIAVLSPTYGEHAHVWRARGHVVSEVADVDGFAEADIAIVTNPNNPDGRIIPQDRLHEWAARLAARGGFLIVDEAFADPHEAVSIVPSMEPQTRGLIVFRSFGKFYGLAGLRLGFAISDRETVMKIRDAFGPWAVSGPAMEIGTQAFEDEIWRETTRLRLARDSQRLATLLTDAGLEVLGRTSLFCLAGTEQAADRYKALGEAGILVRPFSYAPDWLRFGLPGSEPDWARLAAALGR